MLLGLADVEPPRPVVRHWSTKTVISKLATHQPRASINENMFAGLFYAATQSYLAATSNWSVCSRTKIIVCCLETGLKTAAHIVQSHTETLLHLTFGVIIQSHCLPSPALQKLQSFSGGGGKTTHMASPTGPVEQPTGTPGTGQELGWLRRCCWLAEWEKVGWGAAVRWVAVCELKTSRLRARPPDGKWPEAWWETL